MNYRRRLFIITLCIIGFLCIYLYYVKKQRLESIAHYFPDPRPGDVYKMKKETHDEGYTVYYLKIKNITPDAIYFYPSQSSSNGIHDAIMNHFDTTETVVFSKKDLQEIRDGKRDNAYYGNEEILEIARK